MSYLELLKLASPEGIVVVTALVVLAIGLTTERASASCSAIATLGLAIAIGAVLMLPPKATLFGGMLAITPLTSLFKIICLGLALFTVFLAHSDRPSRNPGEYLAMLLLATIGLMLLVGSEELLMIFIGLELLGLSLYVMTAFDKTDVRSAEAGLKYFLFGSTASAFTLFGISFIYGMSGTTGLSAIGQKLSSGPVQPLLAVGIVMTLIGFAFKIAAAPFHLWAPDAYQGAPVPSAAFIASGSKVASFVVLGKIVLVGFAPVHGSADWHAMVAGWSPVLAALAASSILVGNLVALAQTNVRRLLAYSAVAHAGYTLLGLVAGGRGILRDALLHDHLRCHARRRVWCRRAGATPNWRRRFSEFCRAGIAFPAARWVHVDLHIIAGRHPTIGRIFRKILFVRSNFGRRRKSRPPLARRAGALWQPDFALLLSHRAESDFRR